MLGAIRRRVPGPIKRAIKARIYPDLLAEGDVAPEWHLQSWDGTWHRMRRGRWSILVFYPADNTPGCTKQLEDFQAHWVRLQELGCDVYAINPAEAAEHQGFANALNAGFPILTDRGASVARTYRASVPIPFNPSVIRTVYLINPDRKIRLANRGAPSVAAIVRSIEALQQATRDGQ